MKQGGRWMVLAASCVLGVSIWQSAALADVAASAMSKEEQEGLIFERQQIMIQIEKDAETLGNIAAGLEPKEKLATTTRAVSQGAKDSLESFKAQVPGGRSKPEVWTNHADFMQRMETFVRETEEMAKLGEAGNLSGVTEKLVTALPCRECHTIYRGPRQPKP